MATLSYSVFSGLLSVRSDEQDVEVFALGSSGFSNLWWDEAQRASGKIGTAGHVCGGPIPLGQWQVLAPGSAHPDGGRLRPNWIPIGPVRGRTHIYIHPKGTHTDGCIVLEKSDFDRVKAIVAKDGGGKIYVFGGDVL